MRILRDRFSLSYLSIYRTHIMGVASIMILLCHAVGRGVEMPIIFRWILNFGNYGVDIFLFLSGLGLYYSLSDFYGNIITWYAKRYVRILTPYIIISLPYWTYYCVINKLSILDFLYYFSTIGFWCEHKGAWFVAMLLPLYLIAPILYKLVKYNDRRWLYAVIIFVVIGLFTMIPYNPNSILSNLIFAYKRLPCFVLGMLIAYMVKTNKSIKVSNLLLLCVILYTFYRLLKMINIDVSWFLMIPILSMVLLLVHSVRESVFSKVLFIFGTMSLELYLTNIYLGDLFYALQFPSRLLMYLVVLAVGVILSIIISKWSVLINRKLSKYII